ncbi:MAG: AmmeMemoRadiSam system protein A [Patescibacteria group bacterium]|nr:AmmeMemoRadiSam system protein A [Patescibacteria group bacterium]MCL5095670.1 AmmeMemoRadiSam system protein A [Patescibacteria group bacterium]
MIDSYLLLAQKTVEEYVKTGQVISLPRDLPKEMLTKKAGVFISIHQKDGSLRGCIGTFLPTQDNLAHEIVRNAIESATADPRFSAILAQELPDLVYSVDILSEPEPAEKKDLNPKKYGLIVTTADGRRGLLLPDLEGVETIEQQISVCRQKAGIAETEPVSFLRFRVERHAEK